MGRPKAWVVGVGKDRRWRGQGSPSRDGTLQRFIQNVAKTSSLRQGFQHVIHLLHEFTFETSAGQHVYFVTDVLSYNV